MKVAIPTDDGEHISEAFGYARYFLVMDVETRETELRENFWGDLHGRGHRRDVLVAEILKDLDVIITSHMGKPMIDKMISEGKAIYIAPKSIKISNALNLYLEGTLKKLNKMVN